MCGRAVQTVRTVHDAAHKLAAYMSVPATSIPHPIITTISSSSSSPTPPPPSSAPPTAVEDNFNLSPGMNALVILMENGQIRVHEKKWGLITTRLRPGSSHGTPLQLQQETQMVSMCFANRMFNARADTLYGKPTFARLAHQGKTCVVALDGFYEWKKESQPVQSTRKQPYFVYRKDDESPCHPHPPYPSLSPSQTTHPHPQPLFLAGLWTRVSTDHAMTTTTETTNIHHLAQHLDSFTILTTESCTQLQWLHHRMPLWIGDVQLAQRWLTEPSQQVLFQMEEQAKKNSAGEAWAWYKVTPEMSRIGFRAKEAMMPMKESTQSVRHFLVKPTGTRDSIDSDGKYVGEKVSSSSSQPQQKKAGESQDLSSSSPKGRDGKEKNEAQKESSGCKKRPAVLKAHLDSPNKKTRTTPSPKQSAVKSAVTPSTTSKMDKFAIQVKNSTNTYKQPQITRFLQKKK